MDFKGLVGCWVDGGARLGRHKLSSWGSFLQDAIDGKIKNIVIVQ